MTLTYPTPLDPAQVELLLTTGELWVPCPMVPCPTCDDDYRAMRTRESHRCNGLVPDPAWLAAAQPCKTCGGRGKIKPRPDRSAHQPHYDLGYMGEPSKPCPDCRNGHKRIELRMPCLHRDSWGDPCHGWREVGHGEWRKCDCDGTAERPGGVGERPGAVLAATASVAEVIERDGSWLLRLTDGEWA